MFDIHTPTHFCPDHPHSGVAPTQGWVDRFHCGTCGRPALPIVGNSQLYERVVAAQRPLEGFRAKTRSLRRSPTWKIGVRTGMLSAFLVSLCLASVAVLAALAAFAAIVFDSVKYLLS